MQTSFMKSIFYAGLFCAGLSGAASAMPVAGMAGVSSPPVTKVDYACGRGWHLNDWNECVRNRWRRPPPPPWAERRPPPPPWAERGPPPPWAEGRGHWRHHHRPPPPPGWGWD